MSKIEILRRVVLAIREIQAGTAKFYPMSVPCTLEQAQEALQNVARLHPTRGVEITVNDGWVLQPSDNEWVDEEWVEVPQYCGIDIRPAPAAHGPLHVHSREFGVRGLDPWFRNVHPDWAWAVTPF